MDKKLINQLLLYSLPLVTYFVISYATQLRSIEKQNEKTTININGHSTVNINGEPTINIIEYPASGANARAESGYISAYYALQKLGIESAEDRQAFILNSKNAIKKKRLLQATEARVLSDLQDFVAKKPVPSTSPIAGISSHDLKEIITSVFPDIAKIEAQKFINENFDNRTGQLSDRPLLLNGTHLFYDILELLKRNEPRYQDKFKINWTMLEPDLTKDNFAALQKLTGFNDSTKLVIAKNEVITTLHAKFPQEEGQQKDDEATGFWLSPEEINSIISANIKDTDKVMILSDVSLLEAKGEDETYHAHEVLKMFDHIKKKMTAAQQGTQTFIIDKAYVHGTLKIPPIWVPIIVNKQGKQLRLAIVDPENEITKENKNVNTLLNHLK